MSDIKLAFTYLRARPLITLLTIASVALGLGLATIVLMLSRQTQAMLSNETAYWDVVVGAKGSPLQLVLNSLYYLDAPTGNIDVAVQQRLQRDPMVARVVPLTMGDNYFGWPIIGTEPSFFDGRQPRRGSRLLASGTLFAKPFEVVVGSQVAASNHLTLGRQIIGAHGWGKSDELHPQFPYTVVGVLAPTGTNLDRAVYTDFHSTWMAHAHGHEDEHAESEPESEHEAPHEVTALLVQLHQPAGRFRLIEDLNAHSTAAAVSPVEEIDKLARTFITPLQGVLLLVAYLVVFVSALSILISLYLTIYQRRRDMAIMRSLGATRADIFRLVTCEAAILSGLGVVIGWAIGHGAIGACSPLVLARYGISLNALQLQPVECVIAVSVWVMGIAAGLLPAIMAYRLPVAETLVRE